jgi:hypothetical protein
MSKVCVAIIAGLLFVGCSGGDTGVEPLNTPPTITFTMNKMVVKRGVDNDLTVVVSDADEDDRLTVTWDITSGTLTPRTSASSSERIMVWDTPSSVGTDTVTVTVTDGEASASVTEEIKRGTKTEETVARATFRVGDSPYILAPNNSPPSVFISGAATTTIEPGVEIYIDYEDANIDVLGTLVANGTESEPVLIRPNDRRLRCQDGRGWWKGIQARSEDQFIGAVNLRHTEISYGEHNIRLIGAARADLRNCRILCAERAGVRITGIGTLIVRDSEIVQSELFGVEVHSISPSSLPDSVAITGCEILNNGADGIHLELPDFGQTVPIHITYNLIKFNQINGIALHGAVFPTIRLNEIWYNNVTAESNIRLMPPFPSPAVVPTLDATENFWNYFNEEQIKRTITDMDDNSSIGTYVVVDPWLDTSPLP